MDTKEFFGGANYDVEIESPSHTKVTVTLRELNALDQAAIKDQSRMIRADLEGEDEAEVIQIPSGTMRLIAVQRAVVKWSLPDPPSKQLLGSIAPWFLDAIYSHVRLAGAEVLEPPAAQEEEPDVTPTTAA